MKVSHLPKTFLSSEIKDRFIFQVIYIDKNEKIKWFLRFINSEREARQFVDWIKNKSPKERFYSFVLLDQLKVYDKSFKK